MVDIGSEDAKRSFFREKADVMIAMKDEEPIYRADKCKKIIPVKFLELYTSVGWEPPGIDQVSTALDHTMATFTAFEFHGKGVGTLLLSILERYIVDSMNPGWAVSLELISTKEAIPFYLGKGFEERPCEWDGPGMFKMIRG